MKATFKAAGTTLNGKQFRAVYISADGYVVTFCAAANALAIGMLNNNPRAEVGATCEVIMLGRAKAKAGSGGWTAGQFLVPDSTGQLVAITLGVTTRNTAVARALTDASEGDVADVFVVPLYVNI